MYLINKCLHLTFPIIKNKIVNIRLISTSILTSLASAPIMESKVLQRVEVIKSPEDKRNYRGIELANRMKVLLVSDSTTDKSAAALSVNVGFMSDPDNVPGLAHFCEHMLFLGTEKYPVENDYTKFLNEHGGSSNASTGPDITKYFFDVIPEQLEPALDRFSQFFINPLFNEDSTERELKAVNSEHEKNISNDSWRLQQLDKHTADRTHPYSKFGTGNKQTLDVIPKENNFSVRDELLKFHSTWYSSNIMTLVILGKEELDVLENMAVKLFSDIENKNVVAPRWEKHPYTENELSLYAKVVPIKDVRNLIVTFPVPDWHEHYKSAPVHYVSHLIGHEGPGSLLSELKARGWSSTTYGGSRAAARGFGFFGVTMDLTEDGMNHIDDIIQLIFQYLNLVRESKPQEWIFNEEKAVMEMHFRFKDKDVPIHFVANYVHNLQLFPMHEVLSGGLFLEEWKPELIDMVLEYLVPEKARVAIVSKKYANDPANQTEPWYGTEYSLTKIPESTIDSWKNAGLCPDLKLPQPNEFIPSDFTLTTIGSDVTKYPEIIYDNELIRLWFKQDDEYRLPKASIRLEFVSPLSYLDPLSHNLTNLFVMLFRDSLNEYAYAAELAGIKWDLSCTKYGMILGVDGFNCKLSLLLEKMLDRLNNFVVDKKRFEIIKETHTRQLKNFSAEQPYQHAVYYQALLLTENFWNKDELLEVIDLATPERLQEFIPILLSKIHVEGLIHGNFDKSTSLDLVAKVEQKLRQRDKLIPLLPRQLVLNREINLDNGCNYLYELENNIHKSSCANLYYQIGLQETKANMLLELFVQIISEPCFDILRTKEQLGYMVFSGLRKSNGVQGLRVVVQSDRHPKYVDQRVEAFLKSMFTYIQEMKEEDFQLHKDALTAQRLEKPKRLSGLSSRFWSEIATQQYNFDRADIEVNALKGITKPELIEFFKEFFLAGSDKRNKLAVHVISTADGGAGNVKEHSNGVVGESDKTVNIADITVFKTTQSMFPLVQPFIQIARKGNRSKL